MNKKISDLAVRLIKKYEGFSEKKYICPAGYETIGYGHVIGKDEKLESITRSEAENLLLQDLLICGHSINKLITVTLKPYQFDALMSFRFNLGGGALQRSTLRQKINRGEFDSAADEFDKWVYAGGIKLPGLVARRKEEREIFCGAEFDRKI